MAENVRVAVRLRPFNEREIMRNAKLVLKMDGNSTFIYNPVDMNVEPKKYTFDYSYWSHDNFKEEKSGYLSPFSPQYADQRRVFGDLGEGVLDNAWNGYNCSLFAYGQTGSGKSYSMVGYGANKGIVPVTCERLFEGILERKDSGDEFQVSFSMLEIYNEQIRDLLNTSKSQRGGLKVRESQTKGFYVENLTSVAVKNYIEIDGWIAQGTKNRTVASTNMNATSSRAHTIVAINFNQRTKNTAGRVIQRTSVINLVDLAGSERADSTGATGSRLKEGAAINKSLSTLGNTIKALAENSNGKKIVVPYRDSVLTKLLKNALGGNSKTIMIAALSPADINYEETLSTLRFADRAKSIKTRATVNESPTDKLIRELKEENARLMAMLKDMKMGPESKMIQQGASEEEITLLKREMEEEIAKNLEHNQKEMENIEMSWQQRLVESQLAWQEQEKEERKKRERRKTTPHFWNLNEDPLLTNTIVHLIGQGESRIGNSKAKFPPEISLNGLSILADHAIIENEQNEHIFLQASSGAKILLNGKIQEEEKEELHHNDRILFGSNHLYIFHHPKELATLAREGKIPIPVTFDKAQEEIAHEKGIDISTKGKSLGEILLRDDLISVMPMIQEANAIAEELEKPIAFEIFVISPQTFGMKDGKPEVKVQMKSLVNDYTYMIQATEFIDLRYRIQEVYQNFMQGFDWDLPKDEDPFILPAESESLIGTARVYLQTLLHKLDLKENLVLIDYKGTEVGSLQVSVCPCEPDGGDELTDHFIEDPLQLLGKPLHICIQISQVTDIPRRYRKNLHCRYTFYLDTSATVTEYAVGMSDIKFNHKRVISIDPVVKQFIDYVSENPLVIEVWGQQSDILPKDDPSKSEKGRLLNAILQPKSAKKRENIIEGDCCRRITLELRAIRKKMDKQEEKLQRIKVLTEKARNDGYATLPIDDVTAILESQSVKGMPRNKRNISIGDPYETVKSKACSVM